MQVSPQGNQRKGNSRNYSTIDPKGFESLNPPYHKSFSKIYYTNQKTINHSNFEDKLVIGNILHQDEAQLPNINITNSEVKIVLSKVDAVKERNQQDLGHLASGNKIENEQATLNFLD